MNSPELRWKTFETDHFIIHYYDEVEWTARKVASIADEIYVQVTELYEHKLKTKTNIVVRDDHDLSNGFAVYNLGWVTIWASPSTLSLRGRHDWVRGVLTHEFAHVVSLEASSGAGSLIEGIRIGGIGNGNTKENTDLGATALIPTHPYYRWWAEGTAQIDTTSLGYDAWDTHRDMLLRSATLENNLLSFNQMRNIGIREHFGGELVYNQGYSFLLWLNETYGKKANRKIANQAAKHWHLDFDTNLEKAIGKPAKTLDREWRAHLKEMYEAQIKALPDPIIEGTRIDVINQREAEEDAQTQTEVNDQPYADGVLNFYPRFSPDGHWFGWISSSFLKLQYLDQPFNLAASSTEPLELEFRAKFYSWDPTSSKLVLSRRRANVLGKYRVFDLYLVDLAQVIQLRKTYVQNFERAKNEEKQQNLTSNYKDELDDIDPTPHRLSTHLRATHLAWSPNGKWIAYAQNKDGHRHLKAITPDGSVTKDLLAIGGDAEILDPAWSPNGEKLAVMLFNHDQSDIWILNADGSNPVPLTLDRYDDREPVFTPDGKGIVFSSDRSGIYQLYYLPLSEKKRFVPFPITNVETGAFMPHIPSKGNDMLYVRFSSFGFKPYRLPVPSFSPQLEANARIDSSAEQQLTPEDFPPLESHRYFPWPRPIRIFPSIMWENDQIKAGLALQVSDYLEEHNFTALGLFGSETDYQLSYLNQMFWWDMKASYTAYIRDNAFTFINDGDGIADEPEGVLRDNIQFIQAGISQDFRFDSGFPGDHRFSVTYDRRFVDRRVGFPLYLGNQIDTEFRLLTNDGVTAEWNFERYKDKRKRDGDINPQRLTRASLTYSFVHTDLYSGQDPNYFYHEVTANFQRYFKLGFKDPWWEHHTFWFNVTGGWKSKNVDINDEFYLGGRLNFRAFGEISSNTLFYGYEDFSISGETMLLLSTGYTFPIARELDWKWSILYVDAIFASLFAEVGNAWEHGEIRNKSVPNGGNGAILLQDVGAQIKMKAFLFSDHNEWHSIFRVAYGFQDDAAHGFSDDDWPIRMFLGIGTNF